MFTFSNIVGYEQALIPPPFGD